MSNSGPHNVFILGAIADINSLLNDKIFDWSKLKAFADDKLDVKKMISLFDRFENTVGKGENAGYQRNQHFLLFQKCFSVSSFMDGGGVVKSRDCVVKS